MPDLSVKGIARVFQRRTAPFLLREVFGIPNEGAVLRPILESIARRNHSFRYREICSTFSYFGGEARFTQIWTHIIVRIYLEFDADISEGDRETLRNRWKEAIERTWSFKWGCSTDGEATCRLTFEVQWWGDAGQDHTIRVSRCPTMCTSNDPCRENAGRWFHCTADNVVTHEFGHLLGLKDEYRTRRNPGECPWRNPVQTGTIMDNKSPCFPPRLMTPFANYIRSQIVAIPEHTHDITQCG